MSSETLQQAVELLASALAGGTTANIASAINQALILINHLTKDDPKKQLKARRDYLTSLLAIALEVRKLETGQDATDLVRQFIDLMDSD